MCQRFPLASWCAFSAVAALASFFIQFSPQPSVSPERDALLVAWLKYQGINNTFLEPNANPSIEVSSPAESGGASPTTSESPSAVDTWRGGIRRYLQIAGETEGLPWKAPKSGIPIPAALVAKQNHSLDYERVDINFLRDSQTEEHGSDDILEIDAQGYKREIRVSALPLTLDPLVRGKGSLAFRLVRPGGWFSESRPVTSVLKVPIETLRRDVPRAISFVPTEHAAGAAFSLGLTRRSPDTRWNSQSKTLSLSSDQVVTHEGTVDLKALHESDQVYLKRGDEYTAVVVIGDADIRERVWCERDDNDQRVGAYNPDVPLLVVTANAWTSLHLTIRARQPGEPLKYQVLALSGTSGVPGGGLLREFIGNHLTKMEVKGRPLNGRAMKDVVKWMNDVLGGESLLGDLTDSDIRALSDHLQNLKQEDKLRR